MAKAVFGLVDSEGQAERLVEGLKTAGFSNNDISVLFPDKSGTRDFAHEQHPDLSGNKTEISLLENPAVLRPSNQGP